MQWSILAVMGTIQVISVLIALAWFRSERGLWGAVALGPAVLALGLLGFGPNLDLPRDGTEPRDISESADFRTRWLRHPEMWGESLGEARDRQGFMIHPFSGYFMEEHPEIADTHWRVQPVNAGLALMEREGFPEERDPWRPFGIVRYLEAEKRGGMDLPYFFGNQRTSPIREDGECRVFFDKTILQYPCDSAERDPAPSVVERLPVGALLYKIEYIDGTNLLSPTQWTRGRLVLVSVCGLLLVASALGLWLAGRGFELE